MYSIYCILITSIIITKYKLTSFVLPFSYQLTSKRVVNSDLLFNILKKNNEDSLIKKFKSILDSNVYYKPTWGIKVDMVGNKEYELYFYNYTPCKRLLDTTNTIDVELVCKILDIKEECPDNVNYVMYSYDIEKDMKSPNFYYVGYTNDHVDYGHSEKNNIMQNKYYRYRIYDIDESHKNYFEDEFIPKDYNSELKVIFLADKLYRNYIGVYYDGITYNVLKKIMNKYKIGIDLLDDYNDDGGRFSVSIDISKNDGQVVRIGVYGILY